MRGWEAPLEVLVQQPIKTTQFKHLRCDNDDENEYGNDEFWRNCSDEAPDQPVCVARDTQQVFY